MSAPVRDGGRGGRRRGVAAAAVALTFLLLAAVVAGPPADDAPLDPRSAGPSGLRGVVDIARDTGVHVDISSNIPSDTSTTVLVARDVLDADRRGQLEEWVEDGGRLVVADPGSALLDLEEVGGAPSDAIAATSRAPGCDLPALAEVGTVTHADWSSYAVPGEATGCFAADTTGAWLVARPAGAGTLIGLGSAQPFLNASLDRDDNAVLAAAVLFPDDGALQVVPPEPMAEGEGAASLLPDHVGRALLVVVVAVLVGLVALGRRLGPPLEERLPPRRRSAELAVSLGGLLQRAANRDGAAARLRAHARREVARLRGGDVRDVEGLQQTASARLGVGPEEARRALVDEPVRDDDELVAIAAAVARVRQGVRQHAELGFADAGPPAPKETS